MKIKMLQMVCPTCGDVVDFSESDLPEDYSDPEVGPNRYKLPIYVCDCGWTPIIDPAEVREELKKLSEAPKQKPIGYWKRDRVKEKP